MEITSPIDQIFIMWSLDSFERWRGVFGILVLLRPWLVHHVFVRAVEMLVGGFVHQRIIFKSRNMCLRFSHTMLCTIVSSTLNLILFNIFMQNSSILMLHLDISAYNGALWWPSVSILTIRTSLKFLFGNIFYMSPSIFGPSARHQSFVTQFKENSVISCSFSKFLLSIKTCLSFITDMLINHLLIWSSLWRIEGHIH